MGQDLIDRAHARLTDLAARRRKDAEAFPPLHHLGRRRLQEEVARRRSGDMAFREAAPGPARTKTWLRGLLAWVAVGGAAAVLIYVIRFPEEPQRVGQQALRTSEPVVPNSRENPPEGSVETKAAPQPGTIPVAAGGVGAGALPLGRPGPVDFSAPQAAPRESAGMLTLANAELIRQRFTSIALDGSQLPVLRNFEVVRLGDIVRIREPDGSVYEGRITPIRSNDGGIRVWVFEGTGLSRSLSKPVMITGNFEAPEETAAQRGMTSGAYLRHPMTGSILIDGKATHDLRALPAEP